MTGFSVCEVLGASCCVHAVELLVITALMICYKPMTNLLPKVVQIPVKVCPSNKAHFPLN